MANKILLALLALLLVSCSTPTKPATSKPNFSGTWKLRSTGFSEIYTYSHREPEFRVVMRIDDPNGQRTMDVSGQINGQDRKSTRLNSSHIQKSRMPSSA